MSTPDTDTVTALVAIACGVAVLAALVLASRYTRSLDEAEQAEQEQAEPTPVTDEQLHAVIDAYRQRGQVNPPADRPEW